MTQRRIVYFTALAGCVLFYWANRAWLSGLMLAAAVFLPWLSLLLSLPSMISCRVKLQCADHVTVGTPLRAAYNVQCRFPVALISGRLRLLIPATGAKKRIKPGAQLPTAHCGAFRLQCHHLWICDYLGLFSFPIRLPEAHSVVLRPIPVPIKQIPELERYLSCAWRPKRGGGFAENHELRLYRPGDSVQQIHWKLSAKTGKLILREPMEPEQGRVLLRLDLMGTPEELDRKLGRLLWLGSLLLDKKIRYEVQCLTGEGFESWAIASPAELQDAMVAILSRECATEGSIRDRTESAVWQYYIGGGSDEA